MGQSQPELWLDTDLVFRYRKNFEKMLPQFRPEIETWINQTLQKNPRWLGLCIFSQRSLFIAEEICKELRSRQAAIKIVIGGPYVNYCGPEFLERKLCDVYIQGEGEEALTALLEERPHPGINGFSPQLEDLDHLPAPNYDDYDFKNYSRNIENPSNRENSKMGSDVLYITGSRGCVRRCTFCDVGYQWKKFRYRSADKIADEMILQYQRYGLSRFYFTDSLLNGSVPNLKKLCEKLIEYYDEAKAPRFRWQGQFICRPESQMPPEMFDLMAAAGYEYLIVGVESISENVRKDMRKHFSNQDLFYTLRQCERVGLEVTMLMMVGYPTETEEDFRQTLQFFRDNLHFKESGTIRSVALGPTAEVVKGSPLSEESHLWSIDYDESGHWFSGTNTMEVRIDRYIRFHKYLEELGYPLVAKTVAHLQEEQARIMNQKKSTRAEGA
ncbi:MAG: B12-binding domain-containing radical SAM protein [Bdellovibrionales bacterium]